MSVAAGLAYGAIGTDTAGSIRFPSACNGLVGLKPTWGRVSRHGVFPLSDTFDHVGPMARTVLDAALMFDAIAGADPLDPTALDEPALNWALAAREGDLKDVRIGVDPGYALSGLDQATTQSLKAAISILETAGAEIVEVKLPDVRPILERAIAAALVEAAISHAANYPSRKASYSKGYRQLLDTGRATSALDYAAIAIWRRQFHGHLMQIFQTVDVMLTPVVPIEPPSVSQFAATLDAPPLSAAPLLAYTIPFNLAGVPSLTLPMERSASGTPLGIQLIGPDLDEAALLSAGAAYESASGFSREHPDI